MRKAMNLGTIESVSSDDDYRVNHNNPVNCCDAQSNETPRAKAAGVAVGKRMLELLGGIGESSNTQFHLYFNHRMTGHP